jgi:hypothetical protein
LSPVSLRKRAASYVPALNKEGQLDALVMSQMNCKVSSEEIARQLMQSFPDTFVDEIDALTRVGELAQKYSY